MTVTIQYLNTQTNANVLSAKKMESFSRYVSKASMLSKPIYSHVGLGTVQTPLFT